MICTGNPIFSEHLAIDIDVDGDVNLGPELNANEPSCPIVLQRRLEFRSASPICGKSEWKTHYLLLGLMTAVLRSSPAMMR